MLRKSFGPAKPLWPYSDDDPVLLKLKEDEERRKREEEARRLEEERKAAELAAEQAKAAAAPKGKAAPAAPPKGAPPTQSRAQLQSAGGDRPAEGGEENKEPAKKLPNSKDEEEKEFNFPYLDQVLTEITS